MVPRMKPNQQQSVFKNRYQKISQKVISKEHQIGAICAQDASKPAPEALQDPSNSAKEPARAAKRPPRAPRDPPGVDFDLPRGRLGVDFDPPKGPGDLKKLHPGNDSSNATTSTLAFHKCRVGGCPR